MADFADDWDGRQRSKGSARYGSVTERGTDGDYDDGGNGNGSFWAGGGLNLIRRSGRWGKDVAFADEESAGWQSFFFLCSSVRLSVAPEQDGHDGRG